MSFCQEPLIERFFSIVGRMGVFGLLLESDSDLTLNQLRILFHLYYHGTQNMGQIAERLNVSQPAATGIVDRLVDPGLVERVADPSDRRRVCVQLAEAGREKVVSMRSAGAEAATNVFAQLDASQREALFQALEPVFQLLMPSED